MFPLLLVGRQRSLLGSQKLPRFYLCSRKGSMSSPTMTGVFFLDSEGLVKDPQSLS